LMLIIMLQYTMVVQLLWNQVLEYQVNFFQ
jgi:hypothetical protein